MNLSGVLSRDEKRPGKPILLIGGALFFLSWAIYTSMLFFLDGQSQITALMILIFLPLFIFLLFIFSLPPIFVVCYIIGTPIVSFGHVFYLLKKNIRGVVGVLLILGVIAAAASLWTF